MSKSKNTPIKYTSREYNSIRDDLIQHAKRYYPDTWKDFSKGTINSLLVDVVAYVGDVLSYYLDYQVNESFLDTAIEFDNIRKHARALGYKYAGSPSSYGVLSFYVLIPANSNGTAPDRSYLPVVAQGTSFLSNNGSPFFLTEDVRFDNSNNEFVAARQNPVNGATTYFAVKAFGQVSSGKFQRGEINLANSSYQKFRRIRIGPSNISEVYSVVDSDGNKYYEVDNLAQEVVFLETTNPTAATDGVRSIIKPFVASRRFTVEQDDTGTYLQFGFGSDEEITTDSGLAEPSRLVVNMHGRRSISDMTFDPSKLIGTNKLGIAPSRTILTITTRTNDFGSTNAATGDITQITNQYVEFEDIETLTTAKVQTIIGSLEVINESPIVGSAEKMTNEELKQRAKSHYSSQKRAVTKQDYISLLHSMPKKFGAFKRIDVIADPSHTNNRIAIYVISEAASGKLATSGSRIKSNAKIWLMQYKSLNDAIDIYDAKVLNFGIDFKVVLDQRFSNLDVIGKCIDRLKKYFADQLYIGEPIYITRLYSILGKVQGVADVKKVDVYQKSGGSYSSIINDFDEVLSRDGTYIKTPKNVIMELKYPDVDIKGTIV